MLHRFRRRLGEGGKSAQAGGGGEGALTPTPRRAEPVLSVPPRAFGGVVDGRAAAATWIGRCARSPRSECLPAASRGGGQRGEDSGGGDQIPTDTLGRPLSLNRETTPIVLSSASARSGKPKEPTRDRITFNFPSHFKRLNRDRLAKHRRGEGLSSKSLKEAVSEAYLITGWLEALRERSAFRKFAGEHEISIESTARRNSIKVWNERTEVSVISCSDSIGLATPAIPVLASNPSLFGNLTVFLLQAPNPVTREPHLGVVHFEEQLGGKRRNDKKERLHREASEDRETACADDSALKSSKPLVARGRLLLVARKSNLPTPFPHRMRILPELPHTPVLRSKDVAQERTSQLDAAETEEDEIFREQARNAKYSFSSSVEDSLNDQMISKQETRDGLNVKGSYSYRDGYFERTIHYEADENGYRVVKEETKAIGDGPKPNPNGQAVVRNDFGNAQSEYAISADDLQKDEQSVRSLEREGRVFFSN
ncbi:hypothetical protein J437_LFUL009173 [Ladona fulva]|uniref:Uncharacterized protein n=1 Tax=Ladona fulva TaxID=123851 RepID=A0A8K0JZG0_LADFU|nr:hypothetical protein J437_LFUL009173 [Ladona fulva]